MDTDRLFRLMLIANITSLEIQTTSNISAYATSAFQSHSFLSTVTVIQGVVSGESLCLNNDAAVP